MIRIGTSGFNYDDWVGVVYPEGLPARDQLSYYAREFSTVELNVTYYRIPDTRMVAGWAQKTPPGFVFSAKAYQELTPNTQTLLKWAQGGERTDFEPFVAAMRPLQEAGKLACILAQFSNSFRPGPEEEEYLRRLREGLRDLPVVVELRNAGWVKESTFELLRELGLGYCCVDEPRLKGLMPPIAVATGPVAYVRFHGRNAAKWYAHEQAWERYNYTYSPEELQEWVPKVQQLDQMAEDTLVYFNNHYSGQSVKGARDLQGLLTSAEAEPS